MVEYIIYDAIPVFMDTIIVDEVEHFENFMVRACISNWEPEQLSKITS